MRKPTFAFIAVSLLALNGCDKTDKALNSSSQAQTNFSVTLPISDKPSSIGGACALDTINGTITKSATVAKTEPLIIGGWSVNDTAGMIPEQVIARLSNNADGSQVFYAATSDRISRPDVATALKNQAFEKSGFNLITTLKAVPSGQYTLELLQPTASALLVCPTEKGQIVVQ